MTYKVSSNVLSFTIIIFAIFFTFTNQTKFTPKTSDFDLNFDWYHEGWFADLFSPNTLTETPTYINKVISPPKNSPYYTIIKTKQYFPETGIMHEISRCESGRIHRKGRKLLPDGFGGTSRGTFQLLLKVHHEEMQKMGLNPNRDDDYFTYIRHLYDTKGTQPWYMSETCWGNSQRVT